MIWRSRRDPHVSDAVLAQAYLDGKGGAALSEAADHHLLVCETCASRRERLTEFLDGVADVATSAADADVTPEHLAGQRQRIMRRLGTLIGSERPARVLRFPSFGRTVQIGGSRRYWLAVATTAGLFIGILAGQVIDVRQPANMIRSFVSLQPVVADTDPIPSGVRLAAGPAVSLPDSDEAFLVEIETALGVECVAELQALDALTPRVYEVALNVR